MSSHIQLEEMAAISAEGSDSEAQDNSIDQDLKKTKLEYYTYALEQEKLRSSFKGIIRTPSYWSKFLPALFLGFVAIGALISRDALKEDVRELNIQMEDMKKQAKEVQVLFSEQREQFRFFKQNATTEMQIVIDNLQVQMANAKTTFEESNKVLEEQMKKQKQEGDNTIQKLQAQIAGTLEAVELVFKNSTKEAKLLTSNVRHEVDQLEQQIAALQDNTILQEAQAEYNQTLALKKTIQKKTDEAKEIYQDIQEFNATYRAQITGVEQKIDEVNLTSISMIQTVTETFKKFQVTSVCQPMLERPEKLPLSYATTCAALPDLNRKPCETDRFYRDGLPLRDVFELCAGTTAANAPCADGATLALNLTSVCPKDVICPLAPAQIQTELNCTSKYALYAVGGYNGVILSSVKRFDGTSWAPVASMSTARMQFATAVYQGYLYAVGGAGSSSLLSSVERFDGTSWAPVAASMSTVRFLFATAVYQGYLFAVGGNGGSGYLSSVERFDGTSWAPVASMSTARGNFASAVYQGYLYAVGGYSGSGSYLSSVERFDGTSWAPVTKMSAALGNFETAVFNTTD